MSNWLVYYAPFIFKTSEYNLFNLSYSIMK